MRTFSPLSVHFKLLKENQNENNNKNSQSALYSATHNAIEEIATICCTCSCRYCSFLLWLHAPTMGTRNKRTINFVVYAWQQEINNTEVNSNPIVH